jgi:DNA-binding MarR family transcriptional regulator
MSRRQDVQPALRDRDYARLAGFRYALRRFLHFSETAARETGLSPGQYQLLLFVRAFGDAQPTVTDLAERLQVRHQSAVGIVERCERAGLVRRRRDRVDRRRVRVGLTARGSALVRRLAIAHRRELGRLRTAMNFSRHSVRFPISTR